MNKTEIEIEDDARNWLKFNKKSGLLDIGYFQEDRYILDNIIDLNDYDYKKMATFLEQIIEFCKEKYETDINN